jgi:hypothetical protein
MKKHNASHFDHGLNDAQIDFLMKRFAERDAFFIETVELPEALGTVPCGLHGPLVGGAPVEESEVTYAKRGTRAWSSRLVERPKQQVRTVTVIAGPHEEHTCIVYTMYGGPLAPQEPDDPGCKDVPASRQFWTVHALTRE